MYCLNYVLLASCPSAEGTSPAAKGACEEIGTNLKKYNLQSEEKNHIHLQLNSNTWPLSFVI